MSNPLPINKVHQLFKETPSLDLDLDADKLIAQSKKLRIITTAVGEMGHFFPIVRITAALEKAGHEVIAVMTNGYAEEKAHQALKHHGVKAPLICVGDYSRKAIWRDLDHPDVPNSAPSPESFSDERVVGPFREKVKELKPDLIVASFEALFAIIISDDLEIPLVINAPMPFQLMLKSLLPGVAAAPWLTPLSYPVYSCFCCLCISPSGIYDIMKCAVCVTKCMGKF